MRRLVVLGAGTAGTMIVNRLRRQLHPRSWKITVVDQADRHVYQPGLLFIPFGQLPAEQLTAPHRRFIPDGVDLEYGTIELVDPVCQKVHLTMV